MLAQDINATNQDSQKYTPFRAKESSNSQNKVKKSKKHLDMSLRESPGAGHNTTLEENGGKEEKGQHVNN